MRWFRRRHPMRTWQFVFQGEYSLKVRPFEMRANLLEEAADEARRALSRRYDEPHVLTSYEELP